MACGRRHRREVPLAQIDASDRSCRQRRGQRLLRIECQTEFVVVCPPGQLRPMHICTMVLRRQRQQQQQGWALATGGQAEPSVGQDLQRLVLPDHRLVGCGMVRRGGLEACLLRQLQPPLVACSSSPTSRQRPSVRRCVSTVTKCVHRRPASARSAGRCSSMVGEDPVRRRGARRPASACACRAPTASCPHRRRAQQTR